MHSSSTRNQNPLSLLTRQDFMQNSTSTRNQTQSSLPTKRKPFSSHPWRLPANGKAKKSKPVTTKLIYIWLLDHPNDEESSTSNNEYTFNENMVLVKGYVSISSDMDYLDIKIKILELINTKFPEVKEFEFLKRERHLLFTPTVPIDWDWGYENVKALLGQGKLYLRLAAPCRTIIGSKKPITMDNYLAKSTDSINSISSDDSEHLPSVMNDHSYSRGNNESPNIKLESNSELQSLVNTLLDNQEKSKESGKNFSNLQSALEYLKFNVLDEKKRIRIHQSNALEEGFELLKGQEFDQKEKLVVSYKNQPAIDTGGVLRQFYTDCFAQMVDGGNLPAIFEGNDNCKVPVSNSAIMLSGIMELTGKLIAHSIVQANIGIGYLAPCVYEYLVTGDLSAATELVSIDDSFNDYVKDYNKRVNIIRLKSCIKLKSSPCL